MTRPPEHPPSTPHERAWVDVDLGALRRNAERIAAAVAPARLVPMVKADAYGLGAVPAARTLESLDPFAFGVATPAEGVELRAAGLERRVIVFAPSAALDADQLLEQRLDACVLSLESLDRLADRALGVHLEVDTGMGRAGLPAVEAGGWAEAVGTILREGSVRLESVYTHFHSAFDRPGETQAQLARLQAAVQALEGEGVEVPMVHAANSDAAIRDPQYHLDLVRPGIYLYGGRRGTGLEGPIGDPDAVARVRARVLEVRDLAPGSTVSYGAHYTTPDHARIATVGVGYADGVPWRLSNRGEVLIRGQRAPIRGNVCMDVIAVDVSEVSSVQAGDVATLLGPDGDEEILLGEVAETAQTIEYEILTSIGNRLPRLYRDGDRSPERSE